MTVKEKKAYQAAEYAEAMRYMDNAKETLKKSKMDRLHYADKKYVRTACGTAYNGVLIALDAWLTLKGVNVPRPNRVGSKTKKVSKNINFYTDSIAKLDKKMLQHLNDVYVILHLNGYYDGVTEINTIKGGFGLAYEIIDKIKPAA